MKCVHLYNGVLVLPYENVVESIRRKVVVLGKDIEERLELFLVKGLAVRLARLVVQLFKVLVLKRLAPLLEIRALHTKSSSLLLLRHPQTTSITHAHGQQSIILPSSAVPI